jgi:hypothetical protein
MTRFALTSALVALAALALSAGPSWAGWNAAGHGAGSAKARTMPSGNTPTVSVSGRNVTLSWSESAFAGGPAVAGYSVKRYDATSGAVQGIGSGCSGTISALTCTENAVSSGGWRYAVTPVQASWLGGESARSTSATVGSPALGFSSSTTLTSLPATLSGSVANFLTGETLSFRLDNPSTGTLLSGNASPSSIPSDGSATITVTIPAGVSSGSHTVYAVGSAGSIASAAVTVYIDTVAPTVSATVVAKTQGGTTGYIKQGGTYYVYANVTDGGTPTSGVQTVTANVSSLSSGQTAVALSSGSFTAGGTSYGYRSASLTASNPLAAGSASYSITSTDSAGNFGTQSSFSVTVDNTAPSGSDVQTANAAGGTQGKPESGDSIIFSFSETIDPNSILAGWNGTSTSVTVRLVDGGGGSDTLQVWNAANTAQLPLGQINLGRKDYVTASVNFTSSSMVESGTTITIALGTASGSSVGTAAANGTMAWTPSASATDRAGNACSTASVTESAAADKDF